MSIQTLMIIENAPNFIPPHGNTLVWRYITLEKFIDLLLKRRLHFANTTSFTDQYEATIPARNIEAYRRSLEQQGMIGRELEEAVGTYHYKIRQLRSGNQINCWSMGRHESYALWRIYLANSYGGVAIRSTVGRLKKAIERGDDPYPDTVYLGKVRYSDYIPEDQITRYSVLLTKTNFYKFENELRMFILEFPISEGGVKRPYNISDGRAVKVDLDSLIEEVYLSPFMGSWFEDTFRALVKRLCPSIAERIVRSQIRDS